jgi:hypothetical protein
VVELELQSDPDEQNRHLVQIVPLRETELERREIEAARKTALYLSPFFRRNRNVTPLPYEPYDPHFYVAKVKSVEVPPGSGMLNGVLAGIFSALVGTLWQAGRRRKCRRPPLSAEYLFYLFLDHQHCDALVGDLEERYKLIHKKFGRRRADLWYWTQMVASLGPIVWAWAKNVVMKPVIGLVTWAVAKGLIGHDGWVAAVVELWKRIRS